MIFDNIDILYNIYINLPIRERIEFIKTNKFLYENFKKGIQKYKLKSYANKDYVNFYYTLKDNTYEDYYEKIYMNKIITKCFMCIPVIQALHSCGMYDLRFIFELIFNRKRIRDLNQGCCSTDNARSNTSRTTIVRYER